MAQKILLSKKGMGRLSRIWAERLPRCCLQSSPMKLHTRHALAALGWWAAYALAWGYEPQVGDIVFHTSLSSQSRAVQAATRSPYSHMGIVLMKDGRPQVLEAIEPVRFTPLQAWLDRGRRGVPSQALVVSADGRWLYVSARWARKMLVIDTVERKVARAVQVGKSPHGVWTLRHAKR